MCMGMRVARYGWRGRWQHGGRVCDLFGVVAERARVHVGGLWGVEVEVAATRGGGQVCMLVCRGVAVLAMCAAGVVRVRMRESFIGLASGVPCLWGAVGVWALGRQRARTCIDERQQGRGPPRGSRDFWAGLWARARGGVRGARGRAHAAWRARRGRG